MRDNPSIADRVVFTLGELERMADGMEDNDPMRHTVRKMKRTAEQAVIEGVRLAQEIADATRQMRVDAKVSNKCSTHDDKANGHEHSEALLCP